MVQKWCVLRHPHRTPWVPNGLARGAWGGTSSPNRTLLAAGKNEAGHRTLSSHGPENPEEKEIALSLRKWVPLALGIKQNTVFSSQPSTGGRSGAVLAVS